MDEQILNYPENHSDCLTDLLKETDAFIGVSTGGVLNGPMLNGMAKNPIILAMANPEPEILPQEALAAGAAIVGTGRMDYPNQINNVLAFPGLFRGLLDAQKERAPKGLTCRITNEVQHAAVHALAHVLDKEELKTDSILPSPMDPRVVPQISKAVYNACLYQ